MIWFPMQVPCQNENPSGGKFGQYRPEEPGKFSAIRQNLPGSSEREAYCTVKDASRCEVP